MSDSKIDLRDDLIYRSAKRLVKLMELNCPKAIFENEIRILNRHHKFQTDDPEGYEIRCLQLAADRDDR